MNRISTAARVGAFVVVMTGAAIYVYRYVSEQAGGQDGYTVYCLMKDAQGVARHSQVKMAGIPIGNVKSVRLEGGVARVDITVDKNVPLYDDASVSKVTSSLLGEYYLGLAAGTEGKRVLGDGDQVRFVTEATTTDDIMKDLSEIAADVKKVTGALAKSVGTPKGEDEIRETLANLAQITDNLNKIVAENRQTIRSVLVNVENITKKGEPEIDRILQNVRVVTQDVRDLVARSEADGVEAGELRQIVEKVNRSTSSLESALANIDTVTQRLESGEGTLGRLSKDETLIDEVQGVVEGANEFVSGISRLQTLVELRSEYQFLASTTKSYVKLRLQPREDKYYLIELISDPKGYTTYEQIDIDSTNPNDPPHYREVRTTTRNQFRFSFEFAKSVGPFTGRFGIIESTGGVGLDLLLLDDRFELSQDIFGFGEFVPFRYRVHVGYEFVNHLWLLAGVDDILSEDRRDYFLGLSLRYNDQDLRAIVPLAGSAAGAM
ncbi:MAG: MCE family protein [Polyangiaceae bacterium]|nr:MCE family protein [Polyangiaceae bacterium]